jgi:hypothetical protein
MPPRYKLHATVAENNLPSVENPIADAASGADIVPPKTIKEAKKIRLLDRNCFDILNFIETRMVGLVPLAWLSLLLILPSVLSGTPQQKETAKECAVYYIFLIQTWSPMCHADALMSEW